MGQIRKKSIAHFSAALTSVVLAACGSNAPGIVPPGKNASVVIENESQYALRELRLHPRPPFLESTSVLKEAMGIRSSIVFYGSGSWYVTVFREKYKDGPVLAFTTSRAVVLERGHGYRLLVFDDSFRMTDEARWLDPQGAATPIAGDPDG